MRMTRETIIDSATAATGSVYGNTYRFEAVVEENLSSGLVEGSADLEKVLGDAVREYDGQDLSLIFDDPSCLSLALAVGKKLAAGLKSFHSLRVWEGNHRWIELTKNEAVSAPAPAKASRP